MSTINEKNKKIDYKKTKLDDRLKIVDEILEDGLYEDYFDNRFKANITNSEGLSEENDVCKSLEKMANYLLNSDEVKKEKREDEFEYKFYSDEEAFQKAINREPSIDGMGETAEKENIIHFLKNENRNFKKQKIQRINKKDLEQDNELGQILRDYTDYLEKVTEELNNFGNSKLSRFRLSNISGQVKDDMIKTKDMLLGVFAYKTNAEESTVIDWEMVDFMNPKHVRALLYLKPGYRHDEDLMFTIEEFSELIELARPTKLQNSILKLMRDNLGPTEIGWELSISKQRVHKNIDMLVKRICKAAYEQGY